MQQSPDIGNEKTLPAMEQSSASRAERTELERRVLAHERVLQALIAYMSRTEPRFVDHLRERFVEPMRMARHEHDYRGADDYAEEFIRAVMLLGEPRQPPVDPSKAAKRASASENDRLEGSDPHAQRDQVLVQQRNGIWHVTVNGVFRGDYHQEEHANAAAALLKLSLP
ncbi:hypothetical protein [Oceanicella sp. SM1341]|uniref:hypothetical protein n=1 Tax=Oceanicella sp. SM1341 TaxID=1548889 RepID=UPI001E35B694|nr:hypothetical protein [Oceanicella sp. SM1341]